MNALRAVARILFDQEFYRADNKSLEDIYDMYWKINLEVLDTDRGYFKPPWSQLIHHTSHPIYLHNYFMGDVTCEMLASAFNEKLDTKHITDKQLESGKFLYEEVIKNYFKKLVQVNFH